MSRIRVGLMALIVGVFACADLAIAGQDVTAGIVGQVKDESGGVLPGVTVAATSPGLQVGTLTVVTNENGEYRLSPLPIGTYAVVYELSGFQTVRQEGVRLTPGFIAKVDVGLKVGALAETITVSGAAPVVDVTSTTTSTQFTRETLELLPGSRNGIQGIISQAPGVRSVVDVGGDRINAQPVSRVFGQGGEHWYSIEGVPTTDIKGDGGSGNYWDFSAVEEALVQTVGANAEAPTRGVQLNAIVKSGGNDFHGSGLWSYTNKNFQSDNLTPELTALLQVLTTGGGQGAFPTGNPLQKRYDYSGEIGGRVIRNKLWFFGSARSRGYVQNILNAYQEDGSPAVVDQSNIYHTEKLSYQLSSANKVVGFYQHSHKHDIAGASQFVAWESRNDSTTDMPVGKVEWQGTLGNAMVMSVQWGQWSSLAIREDIVPDHVSKRDSVLLTTVGEPQNRGSESMNRRRATSGYLGWYKPDFFHGNHSFKLGADYWAHSQSRSQARKLHNYSLVFQSGVANQLVAYNFPADPWISTNYIDTYAQDSWTMGRRLTLNLGARFAHDSGFVPAACRDAADAPGNLAFPAICFDKVQMNVYQTLAPRVHLAYDVGGDGKTAIKGGWGRFYHMRQIDPDVLRLSINSINTATYRWRDLNGNGDYNPGEVNLDPNGPDFLSTSAGALSVPNPNEKDPTSDEFSVSLERELIANFAMRLTGVYSRYTNIGRLVNNKRPYSAYSIPITNRDPGPDGRVGTADDPGTSVTYYEYPTSMSGKSFEEFTIVNDPAADQDFKSFELAAFKRLSRRWQFSASYSATKKNIPLFGKPNTVGDYSPTVEGAPLNPNAEIFQADKTWEWQGKVSGAYIFPWGVLTSANFESRSGDRYARQVRFVGGTTIPNIVLNVEPIGSRSMPAVNLLDFRVEKSIRLRGDHKLAVRANLYNALNVNTTLGRTTQSGASFETINSLMAPRIVEFSATYTF